MPGGGSGGGGAVVVAFVAVAVVAVSSRGRSGKQQQEQEQSSACRRTWRSRSGGKIIAGSSRSSNTSHGTSAVCRECRTIA